MGSYCYLNNEEHLVSETKNELPFFWFLGCGKESESVFLIQIHHCFLQDAEEDQDNERVIGCIKIPKDQYMMNLINNQSYIQAVYPYLLDIYQQFIIFMEKECHNSLMIDIYYEDIIYMYDEEEAIVHFRDLFQSLDKKEETRWVYKENLVYSTIGDISYDPLFEKYNESLSIPLSMTHLIEKKQPKREWLSQFLIKNIVALVGIVFVMYLIILNLLGDRSALIMGVFVAILDIIYRARREKKQQKKESDRITTNNLFFLSFLNPTTHSIDFQQVIVLYHLATLISDHSVNVENQMRQFLGNSVLFYENYQTELMNFYEETALSSCVLKMSFAEKMLWILYVNRYLQVEDNFEEFHLNSEHNIKKDTSFQMYSSNSARYFGSLKKRHQKDLIELVQTINLSLIFENDDKSF